MSIAPRGASPGSSRNAVGNWFRYTAVVAALGVASVLAATNMTTHSVGTALGVAAGVGAAVWMFFSERLERALAFYLLYLGLLDGFLKLRTSSSVITLGRDALLYAILLGFMARAALRRETLSLPPLSGWILAFTAVVLVQLATPGSGRTGTARSRPPPGQGQGQLVAALDAAQGRGRPARRRRRHRRTRRGRGGDRLRADAGAHGGDGGHRVLAVRGLL